MTQEPTKSPRRWVRWLLIGSLALNLIVVGVVAGAAWRFAGHGRDGGKAPPPIGALLYRDLDRDTRNALRSAVEGDHESFRARRMAEVVTVVTLLRADPFDPAALEGALQDHAARRSSFHQSVQVAWLSQVREMTAQERASYAADLEGRLARHDRKHR